MAFCEKCGKQIGPSGVCDCQKVNVAAPGAVPGAAPAKKGVPNKTLFGIIGAVAAVVVVVVLAIALLGGGSYKTPINKLVKMINKQSTDFMAYQELSTDPITYDYAQTTFKILLADKDRKESYEDSKKNLDDYYDDIKGFKITKVDFRDAEKMKKSELREIQESFYDDDNEDYYEDRIDDIKDMEKDDYEDLADNLDISVSAAKKYMKAELNYYKKLPKIKVTEGYTVEVRIYAKYNKEEEKTEIIKDIKVIKVNGKWIIYNPSAIFRGMEFKNEEFKDIDMNKLYDMLGM